jgi:hypothetical protein
MNAKTQIDILIQAGWKDDGTYLQHPYLPGLAVMRSADDEKVFLSKALAGC